MNCSVWAQSSFTIEFKLFGIEESLQKKLVAMLERRRDEIPKPLTAEKVRQLYQQSPKFLHDSLEPYGYFKSQIRSRWQRRGNTWVFTFQITPGPAVKVIHVDIKVSGEGQQDRAFQDLLARLPVQSGQTLNVDLYQKSKDALFNLAANRGYFDAKMQRSQIIINLKQRQASIVLDFETGKRYRFGSTYFPPSDLQVSLLQRYLTYQTGDYYNNAKVQSTQQALASSGYFYQAVVNPLPAEAKNQEIPIEVELTPVKPQRYTIGLGYGTDTGPRGTLGFNWKPINSYGHSLNMLVRGSYLKNNGRTTKNNTADFSYTIPGKNPATDSYIFTGGYSDVAERAGTANSFRAAFAYNTIIFRNWQQALALTYLKENYSFTNIPVVHANVVYPSGHWQYIRNRSIQNQKVIDNGISATFDVAGGARALLSRTNFLQLKARVKGLATLEATHTRFLGRLQAGHTQIDKLENLPLTMQLLAGGPNTIRGFKYNSLGPGRDLLIGSIEIQQQIYGDFYLAGFFDMGTISGANSMEDSNFMDGLKGGAGGGLAYLTRVGTIEVSLARPVLNADGNKTWQLEFSVGAEL